MTKIMTHITHKSRVNVRAECRSSFFAIKATTACDVKRHYNTISLLQQLVVVREVASGYIEDHDKAANRDTRSHLLQAII